jgi:hypothetical protein
MRENAGRAIHAQYPVIYEQARTKWVRILENNAANAGDAEPIASGSGTQHTGAKSGAVREKAGTSVRGRGGRGGRGGPAGGGRITPRTTYQGPIATLQGLRSCYGYNDDARPCTRQMRDASTCMDPSGRDVFIHCCSYYDAVTKKHCLSMNHARFNGNH